MHTLRYITTEGMWLHLKCGEMKNGWGVWAGDGYISMQLCRQGEGKERDPGVFLLRHH